LPEPATPRDAEIFHICNRAAYDAARRDGEYRAESLMSEGFIHLSRTHQVAGTARAFFAGVPELVVLVVQTSRLSSRLVYEPPVGGAPSSSDPRGGELFPHVYGPINLDAIIGVKTIADFDETV
jgi:uncharacterized protein (DUF952 family)